MAFIDELKIHLKAGRGGNGVVRWRHEKDKEWGGPSGGDGGHGGDVYIKAVRDLGILSRYRNKKEFHAERGQDGMRNSMHGRDGNNFVLELPIGSIVTNLSNDKKYQLLNDGEEILVLKGGRGGLGNEYFKASTNVRPQESTLGKEGEEADFFIEVELVANAGLIGLPNAGKSSLLNALTNATAKVGDYAFTTLEPNLGDFYGYILADIPGLIEGASHGKGLGHKFLRHIKRTSTLIHCISTENEDLNKAYEIIREELRNFDEELAKKKEIIVLTKTDLLDESGVKEKLSALRKLNKDVFAVSIIDGEAIKKFSDSLSVLLKK